jgi:hypothetical protein
MPTVKVFAPQLSGTTGLALWLRKTSDQSLVNAGGDALTEIEDVDENPTGWFSATVAETWTERLSAAVIDADGLVPQSGWLGVGETVVADVLTGAAELDSATIQEIADAVGSPSVTVLPAVGIVANRSAGVTLLPVVGETISQAITVYQSDGTTAVDLSGKTLAVIFETLSGADVAVVSAANISIGGVDDNVVTFAYPSAVTASERTLRFALRDATSPSTMYLQGLCSVVRAPQVDT